MGRLAENLEFMRGLSVWGWAGFLVILGCVLWFYWWVLGRRIWRGQSQTQRSWTVLPEAVKTRVVGAPYVEELVLRLPRKFVGIAVFNIVFFGGGGWFWAVQNRLKLEALDPRSWFNLVGCLVFVLLGVLILWKCQRRVSFGPRSLTDKRFLRAPRRLVFSDLVDLRTFQKGKPTSGFVMTFKGGAVVRIPASFEGFGTFAKVLSPFHPVAQQAIAAKR